MKVTANGQECLPIDAGSEGVIRTFTAEDGTVFIHETEDVATCPCYSDEESDQ
jgi:hypothetical protein